jgi:hypothetical protein
MDPPFMIWFILDRVPGLGIRKSIFVWSIATQASSLYAMVMKSISGVILKL